MTSKLTCVNRVDEDDEDDDDDDNNDDVSRLLSMFVWTEARSQQSEAFSRTAVLLESATRI